jgi:hypothetical protein
LQKVQIPVKYISRTGLIDAHQGVDLMACTTKSRRNLFSIFFALAVICLMTVAIIPGVMGASAVDLGSAGNYVILTKSGITTTGTTTITGNMGVSPIAATAITGFGLIKDSSNQFSRSSLVSGSIFAADYASPTPSRLTTAVSNMETAYTSAAGQSPPTATELYAGNLGGRTLTPGVYKWSTGVLIPASTALTLDAQGNSNAVWVFQVSGDFTMNSASNIALVNGARAENVFWQIGGGTGVTINSGAHAEGNVLAAKAITMKSGASLHGRALAQTAVTLIANTVTAPSSTPILVQTTTTIPGQTAAPTTEPTRDSFTAQPIAVTVSPMTSTTVLANVGGNSGIYRVQVNGNGNNDIIVTGSKASGFGSRIGQPSGTLYQYIDLVPARYTTIDQSLISFTVPLSWLKDNNIDPQNVVLNNLDGDAWTALPTTFVKSEGIWAYFTAESPEIASRFAITGQYPSSAAPVHTIVLAVSAVAQPPVTTQVTAAIPQPTQSTPLPVQQQSPVPVWVPLTAMMGAFLIMADLYGRRGKNS